MDQDYIVDKPFNKIDFTQNPLVKSEYENCTFNNCDFSNSDLKEIKFNDCGFISCNFSLAKLNDTAFRDIKFKDCKLLGLHFEQCNKFGLAVYFENCILDHSSFYQQKIKKTIFKNTKLQEVDFTETDLSNSIFDNCDLTGAKFDNTILEKADLYTAYNYSIDPELNKIKKAKFSLHQLSGLLDKYDIEIIA